METTLTPSAEPLGAGSNFTYESDIVPLKKQFFQRVMKDRNLTPEFAASISSQFSGALKEQADKDLQLRARDLQYKSSLFTLDREREKSARERRNLQDMAPFQDALNAAISDPTRPPNDRQFEVGRLGVQFAGLMGESPAATAAYRSALGSIAEPTKPKITAASFLNQGGSYDYLKQYGIDQGIEIDSTTEIPFQVFATGLDLTRKASEAGKDMEEEFDLRRKEINARAKEITTAVEKANLRLTNDDLLNKDKRDPNVFDNITSETLVGETINMFGSPEELERAKNLNAEGKLKLAQLIGIEYRSGKRSLNSVGASKANSADPLFD